MGVKKAKKGSGAGLSKIVKKAAGAAKGVIGGKGRSGGVRHRRMTPERLQRKILMLKLKKKLNRMMYGGR